MKLLKNYGNILTIQKFVLLLLSCLLLSCLPLSCTDAAEPTYTITETELEQLEQNLIKLSEISNGKLNELSELQAALKKSNEQMQTLKFQLSELQTESTEQERLLRTVNESFEQYAKEEQRKRKITKWQRDAYVGVILGLMVYIAAK